MLPWSSESSVPGDNMWRYADTGINELISKMCRNGTSVNKLTAKLTHKIAIPVLLKILLPKEKTSSIN